MFDSPGALATRSSSPDLSSPPSDLDGENPSPTRKLLSIPNTFDSTAIASSRVGTTTPIPKINNKFDGVDQHSHSPATSAAITRTPSSSSAVFINNNITTTTTTTTTKSTSVRRSRKKDPDDNNISNENPKSSKKIKTTQSASIPTGTATPPTTTKTARKRQPKTSDATKDSNKRTLLSSSRQPKITSLVGSSEDVHTRSTTITGIPINNTEPPSPNLHSFLGHASKSQNGNSDAFPLQRSVASLTITSSQDIPPARTSGTKYDPIRSVSLEYNNTDPPPGRPTTPSNNGRPTNSASASPSISSLIDPPARPFAHSHPLARFVSNTTETASIFVPSSPSATIQVAQPVVVLPTTQSKHPVSVNQEADEDRNDHQPAPEISATASKLSKKVSPKSSTGNSPAAAAAAPATKPVRRREAPLPPPPGSTPGSGLLSSMLFGGSGSTPIQDSTEIRPTIILDIDLNTDADRHVHFPKLVEARYGAGALDTRMRAHKDRMARIAAASAALERQIGAEPPDDDMADDTDSDSNVEMGETGEAGDGGEKKEPAKKRLTKEDEYDKNDPFVDDSEMVWLEQAASSKDGFFVYQGPLIPAGEEPNIERAEGSTAKKPRATTSRARGATSRATGASKATGTAAATKGTGGTVRKSRITKADQRKMEQEKQERERMAMLAAKPSGYE
ncbi:MAG: hypothetical protein M1816_004131 [Peltula sp. TS41687]|nr:MAG: hypothetical protein M1816_004131 [Peltula sp. TS41687]